MREPLPILTRCWFVMMKHHRNRSFVLVSLLIASPFLSTSRGEAPSTEPDPGSLRLVLPPVLYAVPGLETNVYFDNISLVIQPANYAFDVTCTKGRQQSERWTLVATDSDVGDHSFELTVHDEQNRRIAFARSTLRIATANARWDESLSLLFVGDSLTNASVYPQRVLELCAPPGNPRVNLVGSHGPGGQPGVVRHEGYGGWTAERFATFYAPIARQGDSKQRGSPFLYARPEGAPLLDFTRYCSDVNEGQSPNIVLIFLGPNDIFSLRDDTLEAGIDRMLKHYDQLIAMVQSANSATSIGVMLAVPPAGSQDAFGANYASGQTRWQYKRNQHRLVERMQSHYGRREAQHLFVLPTHVNLDCHRNYPSESVPPNLHAETPILRQNNGVHPAAPGYRQIGDTVYSWLKETPSLE